MPQRCDGCHFGRQDLDGDTYWHCHFRPPQQHWRSGGVEAWWPIVKTNDWCGNWRPTGYTALYIQGEVEISTDDRQLLLATDNPDFPVVSLQGIQLLNQDNKTCVVRLYDGDTDKVLAVIGCPSNQMQVFEFSPGLRTTAGNNLYCGLTGNTGTVFISVQGYEWPEDFLQAATSGDLGSI